MTGVRRGVQYRYLEPESLRPDLAAFAQQEGLIVHHIPLGEDADLFDDPAVEERVKSALRLLLDAKNHPRAFRRIPTHAPDFIAEFSLFSSARLQQYGQGPDNPDVRPRPPLPRLEFDKHLCRGYVPSRHFSTYSLN